MTHRLSSWLFAIAVLGIAAAGFAQSKNAPVKRAKPPEKWDRRVLDVFFPDARDALSGPRPDYGALPAAGNLPGGSGAPGEAQPAGNGFAWSKLISATTLQDEIKALQPQLAADVKTQQVFLGGAYRNARRSLTMLAAAFAIINEFDADVRWKNQAAAARDMFGRAGNNAKSATVQSFNEITLRVEDLAGMLRGETIEPPARIEPQTEWEKVAELPPLMNRLELAQQERVSPAVSSAAELKSNADMARHEAEIVAALAEVIQRDGYTFAGDDVYMGYARAMQEAALKLRAAATDNDYDAARAAAGDISKACSNCHGDYR